MSHPNQDLITRFFEAYSQRDLDALRQVVAEEVRWVFPGRNPFSGTKQGVEEVVAFFDAIGGVMGGSNPKVEVLVTGVGDSYISEVQHIQTQRANGPNLDQYWCVLWTFKNGKITEGRHLASDQHAADEFFNSIQTA